MAKPSRRPRSSLIDALERDPGGFELFQAIRLAELLMNHALESGMKNRRVNDILKK